MAQPEEMYQCQNTNCGYIYNPDKGDRKGKIPAGTRFEDLPDEWRCPICGGTKKCFRPLAGPGSTREVSCPTPTQGETKMQKYVCNICGYVFLCPFRNIGSAPLSRRRPRSDIQQIGRGRKDALIPD